MQMWWLKSWRGTEAAELPLPRNVGFQPHAGIPSPEQRRYEEEPCSTGQWESVGILSVWER